MENYLFEIKVFYPFNVTSTKHEDRTEYVIAKRADIAISKIQTDIMTGIEARAVCKESDIRK